MRILGSNCGTCEDDDEVIELATTHQEMAHGVKEISPDLEKKIKETLGCGRVVFRYRSLLTFLCVLSGELSKNFLTRENFYLKKSY